MRVYKGGGGVLYATVMEQKKNSPALIYTPAPKHSAYWALHCVTVYTLFCPSVAPFVQAIVWFPQLLCNAVGKSTNDAPEWSLCTTYPRPPWLTAGAKNPPREPVNFWKLGGVAAIEAAAAEAEAAAEDAEAWR